MKNALSALLWGTLITAPAAPLAKPSPKQIRFADWEVGAFFHYDLNPFTNQEHGDGQEPPSKFNPTQLDMDQWIRTAKSMGARYEGGFFCLWPSKTTEYSIKNSPYKGGEGALVREFVEACRKHGIEPGLYHTAGFDANAAIGKYEGSLKLPLKWGSTWSKAVSEGLSKPGRREEFHKKQVEQMRELLTWYGPISFLWSDHWDATNPKGVWRAVTDLAAELQPELVFMGPDTWIPGNETGHVVYPMWNAVNTIIAMENIANGQKVEKYTLEAWVDDKWQALQTRNLLMAQQPYNGRPGYETIGHKKIDRVAPVTTDRIRLRCLESIAKPVEIRKLAVYKCDPITRTFDASYPLLSGIDTLHDVAHGGMKRDVNYIGDPLKLDGRSYKHGILLCPVGLTKIGVAEFDLTPFPRAKGMKANIGIEDMTGDSGSCEFIVEGRITGAWRQLYKSRKIKGGDKPEQVRVRFPKGMDQLRLKTTDAGNGANSDHAVWADAQFVD